MAKSKAKSSTKKSSSRGVLPPRGRFSVKGNRLKNGGKKKK